MVRPRETTPDKEEAIKLGEDLVRWATEPTEEKRTSWQFWYAIEHGLIQEHWEALKKLSEFRGYYEIARAALSQKIHNEELEKGMGHRYAGYYDRSLHHYELDLKKKEAEIKRDHENHAPKNDEDIDMFDQLLQIIKNQSKEIDELKKNQAK